VISPEQVNAEYQVQLIKGIWENQDAFYQALTCAKAKCMCHRFAAFVLEEVDWDADEWLASYLKGRHSA
jgi:hypothetical protein